MPLVSKRGRYGSYSFRGTPNRVARGLSYAQLAGAGLAAAGSYAFGRRTTRNLRRVTSGRGITTQYDRSRVYRKKRMPRRKKKAWKRFVRKAQAAIDKTLGSYSIVLNDQVTVSATAETTDQAIGQFALYPMKDGTNAWLNDMAGIAAQFTTDFATTDSTKWGFKSGILDLTVQNTSLDATDGNGYAVEVDVYEMSSSSNWESYGNTPKSTKRCDAPSAPRKAKRDETRSINLRDERGDEDITADLIRRLIDRTREDYIEMLWDAIELTRSDLEQSESDGGGVSG